jgi:two-component system response regulator NreC
VTRTRILIVDDHENVRRGLRLQLEQNSAFHVVGEAADGHEAVRGAEELLPNVVIMDIAMPNLNGLQATAQLVKKNPQIGVLILSVHSDESYIARAVAAGARGYLLKENAEVDLHRAVEAVAEGKAFFIQPVASTDLLAREKELLQLLAEGRRKLP